MSKAHGFLAKTRSIRQVALLVALALLGAGCPPPPPPELVTVEVPADADTTLFESTEGNLANGAGEFLFTGRTDQGRRRRALLRFDVASAVPAGAAIQSAELRLTMTRTISGDVTNRVFVVASEWGEGASDALNPEGTGTTPEPGDATWLHTFYNTENWPEQGGGPFPVEDARATLSVGGLGTYTFTSDALADDVQDWLDGALENFGWAILGDETAITNAKQWRSRESDIEAERPTLTIQYRPNP